MTTLLAGRYELLRLLDSGGMAEVHRARQRGAAGFEKHVVVKRIHPELADSSDFMRMFIDEARLVADLRHPKIVSTLDLGEDDGQFFIVLEYLEGCSPTWMAMVLRFAESALEEHSS